MTGVMLPSPSPSKYIARLDEVTSYDNAINGLLAAIEWL